IAGGGGGYTGGAWMGLRVKGGPEASPKHRRPGGQHRAGVLRRRHVEPSAQPFDPMLHAREAVAAAGGLRVEPTPVVAHVEDEVPVLEAKFDGGLGALRMSRDVVDGFFEDEEELPLLIEAEAVNRAVSGRGKPHADAARHEDVVGKSSRPMREVVERIALRIDGPDDVAHGVD